MHWYSFVILIVFWTKIVVSRKWMEGDIRLIGGPSRSMGTIVILHNAKWGAVCDDQWELKDAFVVCRQLGYSLALRETIQSEFGPGNRRIWLTQVDCKGHEQRLDECSFQGYNKSSHVKCPGRYRSAGVICSTAALPSTTLKFMPAKKRTTVSRKQMALVNVTPYTLATVKATQQILSDWNEVDIKSDLKRTRSNSDPVQGNGTQEFVTKYLVRLPETESKVALISTESTTSVSSLTTVDTSHLQTHSTITRNITLDDQAKSNVTENVVQQESKERHFVYINESSNASSSSYNSLRETSGTSTFPCERASQNNTTEVCKDYFADDPTVQNLEIRLQGGRYEWEGHLQVRVNDGEWGAICSDSWTLREAMVACNQLGEYGKAKQALLVNYFGGLDVPKTVYKIQCVGRESTLVACNITWSDNEHTCSKKTAVAGVVCSHHLPDLVPSLPDIENSIRLQDQPLYYLRCAMEENCLATSAYWIKNTSLTWRNNMRRLLRFSTIVHNRGLADFRPYRPRGQWEWHACHMHYHSMEVFAHYDILDAKGIRLAEGSKASFCLEDTTCDNGIHPQYNCRGFADQGLSVNCSDNYLYDIDCQWIDISDIKPGEYTFLMEINPTMLVAESNFDNNVVSCILYYSGYFASVRSCHFESLLDYRVGVTVLV